MEDKSNTDFMSISRKECLIVYSDMIVGSDRKWNSAEDLAKSNDFGTAVSLLIFSIEELVKSLIVLLDGKGFEFRQSSGIKAVFYDHKIRYVIGYFMFSMNSISEDVFTFIHKLRDSEEERKKFIFEFKNNRDGLIERFLEYTITRINNIFGEVDWFSSMDALRKEGIYSDYKGQFKSPLAISEENYREVFQRLHKVRTFGKGLIDAVESDDVDLISKIKEIQRMFKDDGMYENVKQALNTVSTSDISIFDHLKNGIKELDFSEFQNNKE